MRHYFLLWLCLLSGIVFASPCQAADEHWPLRLQSNEVEFNLTPHFRYLKDPNAELTSPVVLLQLENAESSDWKWVGPSRSNLGTHPGAIWLHTRLLSAADSRDTWKIVFSFARFNRFEAWVRYSDKTTEHVETGLTIPFSQWTYPFHLPTIPLRMVPDGTMDVLIRLESSTPLIIHSTLFDSGSFLKFRGDDFARTLSFSSIMFIVFVFGVVIYFALHQPVVLFFLFQIAAISLYAISVNLVDFQYLWPSFPRFAISSKNVFGGLNFLAIFLMALNSLHVRSGWRYRLLLILAILDTIALVATLFVDAPWFDALLGFLGIANSIAIFTVFGSLLKSSHQARYFFIGYALFLFFMLLHLLQIFEAIPYQDFTPALPYVSATSITLVLLLGFIREIGRINLSLQKEIKERVRVANELSAERNRSIEKARVTALGEMSRNIIHEINTPISILTFKIENIRHELEKGTPDLTMAREMLSSMMQVAQRATSLVHSIRLLARNGENEPIAQFSLNEMLLGVAFLGRQRMEAMGIDIRVTIEATDGIRIYGRQASSFQLVTNLLNNAIDAHAITQGSSRYIEIQTRLQGDGIVVTVEDNASGVPVEYENSVFEPFFTTKPGTSGMGLGLELARKVARDGDGDLILENPRQPTQFSWIMSGLSLRPPT